MTLKNIRKINQICKLGIGGGALAIFLLPEIRRVVPSHSATVLWVNENCKFINIFDEAADDISIMKSYLDEYLDGRDCEARISLREWLKSGSEVASTEELANNQFYRSDFYLNIMKPMGYHHSLYLALKINGDPVGILALHRSDQQCSFSLSERRFLKDLCSSISCALKLQEHSFDVISSESDVGILLFDTRGKPAHISPQGQRLLILATLSEIRKGSLLYSNGSMYVPGEVISMVRGLMSDHNESQSDKSTSWRVRNLWGSFVFQANWLNKPVKGIAGRVVITIQYQEPTLYRVMLRCEELGLTVRQTEVSIGLFRGLSYEVISKNMCVSAHTVIDHAKKIYEKLGIQSRRELHLELLSSRSI